MKKQFSAFSVFVALALLGVTARANSDLDKRVEHGYADSGGATS